MKDPLNPKGYSARGPLPMRRGEYGSGLAGLDGELVCEGCGRQAFMFWASGFGTILQMATCRRQTCQPKERSGWVQIDPVATATGS